jgi:hypothetical protein
MINEFVRHEKRIDFMLFPGIGHEELTEPRLYDGYVWRMVRDYFMEHLKP